MDTLSIFIDHPIAILYLTEFPTYNCNKKAKPFLNYKNNNTVTRNTFTFIIEYLFL